MEIIRSRQNEIVKRFVSLGSDAKTRQETGEFLGAGAKLLGEALASGAEVVCTLAAEPVDAPGLRLVTPELLKAVSPLQHSDGPVFSVKMRPLPPPEAVSRALVLENVQDPGNVGTVLRTADALGIDLVVLCGACADPYNPKTVRASMGAIFRQPVIRTDTAGLADALGGLPLYGAALTDSASDIRTLPGEHIAVAVGNEGRGLTPELLSLCAGTVIIPMRPQAESLNAGVAAAIVMWELTR